MSLATGNERDNLLDFMRLESDVVQRYETRLAALFSGVVVVSGFLLSTQAPGSGFFLFALAFIAPYAMLRISLGRAFHYGLYEEARDRWLELIDVSDLHSAVRNRQKKHADREAIVLMMPHYCLWPTLSFLVPFVTMCIGARQ